MSLEHSDGRIVAEAGTPLPALAKFAGTLGYAGYEFLIGIPGTVGGGVFMNAGLTANGVREISNLVESVEVIGLDGVHATLIAEEVGFSYRNSVLQQGGHFIIRATFRLEQKDKISAIRYATAQHLAERRRKQPLSPPTAGSTFKQSPGGIPAGWYIERAGLKGYQVGGAAVSTLHANWIENNGGATAADIRQLIAHIQAVVKAEHGVMLEREVRYLPDDAILSRDAAGAPSTVGTV